MKTLLYVVGTTLLLLACHQSDIAVSPNADRLYRRWRLAGSSNTFISFLPDGIILYGADGRDNSCCALRYFIRQDSLLVFKDAPAKALPVALKQVNCAAVSCLSANSTEPWRIVSLTDNQLILTWYKTNRIYEAN